MPPFASGLKLPLTGAGASNGRRSMVSLASFAGLPEAADGLTRLAGGAAKVYGAVLVALFFLQRKLIFLPAAQVADPKAQGGEPQVIVLPAGPGRDEQHAAVYFDVAALDAPVLVFFHGNADQLGWGPAYLGRYFKERHGIGFYGIEYPGYGLARPGSPSETAIYEAAEVMLLHLVEVLGVPRSRIVLFGQSIGCGVAVEMAKRGFGNKLVLLSPYTSTADISSALYPIFGPAIKVLPWLIRDRFDNRAKATELSPATSTLVAHGKDDEIVPFWMGQTLAELIPGAKFLPIPGAGHNDLLDKEDLLRSIVSFARLSSKVT